jgi:hypothetical protein
MISARAAPTSEVGLAVKHGELMALHEDLEVFGSVGAAG